MSQVAHSTPVGFCEECGEFSYSPGSARFNIVSGSQNFLMYEGAPSFRRSDLIAAIKDVSEEPITQGSAQVKFDLSNRTFSVMSVQATYEQGAW